MNAQQSSVPAENQPLSGAEVTSLLSTLCTRLELCLPPAESERLRRVVPSTIDAFTDAGFGGEGLPPESSHRRLHHQVRARGPRPFHRPSGPVQPLLIGRQAWPRAA